MGQHVDSARERIIDAAEQVVIQLGAGHLTFDAVASKAGVSRGGLLYHFPDKEALLKGMLDRLIDRLTEGRRRKRAELKQSREREIMAHLLSYLQEGDRTRRAISAALIASGAYNPRLLAPLKEKYRKLMDDATLDGMRLERAAVISLAADGLRILEVLSLSPYSEEERVRIVEEMMALAREGGK